MVLGIKYCLGLAYRNMSEIVCLIIFSMLTILKKKFAVAFFHSFVFYKCAAGNYRLCNPESKFKTNMYHSKKGEIHLGGSDVTHENWIYRRLYTASHNCNSTSKKVRCISRLIGWNPIVKKNRRSYLWIISISKINECKIITSWIVIFIHLKIVNMGGSRKTTRQMAGSVCWSFNTDCV